MEVYIIKVKLAAAAMIQLVEQKFYCYTIIVNQADNYVNFSKLVEVVDKSKVERQGGKVAEHVTLGQWGDTEGGAVTLKAFAGVHPPETLTHYRLKKGVPRNSSGIFIHPNLVYPIIMWRDSLTVFYFASIMNVAKTVIGEESLANITIPSKMIFYEDSIREKPPLLQEHEEAVGISPPVAPAEVVAPHVAAVAATIARGRTRFYKGGGRYTHGEGGGSRGRKKRKEQLSGSSAPEMELLSLLENLLQKPFTKVRPEWLKNTRTGYPMELDMYNDEMKLAVEYNGEQHYRVAPPFTNNDEELGNLKRRDLLKAKLCRDNGVRLITIPYTIPPRQFADYMTKILHSLDILTHQTQPE